MTFTGDIAVKGFVTRDLAYKMILWLKLERDA